MIPTRRILIGFTIKCIIRGVSTDLIISKICENGLGYVEYIYFILWNKACLGDVIIV